MATINELWTEAKKEPLDPKALRKFALTVTVFSIVVWGVFAFAAAAMLVSFGAWAWVVYPFALYWWGNHVGRTLLTYRNVVKPRKVEQNVTINISSEMSPEDIAAAATKAMDKERMWGLHSM